MIKENNLGDTNKLCITLFEVDSLHLENSKMSWKAVGFYRIKNKNKGGKKIKISDWLGPHSQPCLA